MKTEKDTADTRGRAIRTRFLSVTNSRGCRVRAWIADDGKPLASLVLPWSYSGTAAEEHQRAALAVLEKARQDTGGAFLGNEPARLVGAYLGNGEWAFVINP